jgi:hypothetical protein
MHAPDDGDDLGALADALGAGPAASVPPPPRSGRAQLPGGEEDILDLTALAKSATSKPPQVSGRPSVAPTLAERVQVEPWPPPPSLRPPLRTRPSWLVPLLAGLGGGATLGALLFAAWGGRAPAPVAAKPPPPRVAAAVAAAPRPMSPRASAAPVAIAPAPPAEPAPVEPAPVEPAAAAGPPDERAPVAAGPAPPHTVSHGAPAYGERPSRAPAAEVYAAAAPPRGAQPPDTANGAGSVLVLRPVEDGEPEARPAASTPVAAAAAPIAAAPAAGHAPAAGSLDALLDDALSPEARRQESAARASAASALPRPSAAAEPAELPRVPTRDDVARAMSALQPAMRGCAMGQTGVATAAIAVRNDGRVASAQLSGAPFAGTASGRCMEGVLHNARFPRFKEASFSVRYPFSIQ